MVKDLNFRESATEKYATVLRIKMLTSTTKCMAYTLKLPSKSKNIVQLNIGGVLYILLFTALF